MAGNENIINVSEEKMRKISKIRFVFCSLLGVIIFFKKVSIGGEKVLPIDWISSFLITNLIKYPLQISVIGTIMVVYNLIRAKFWKKIKTSPVGFFFDALGAMSFILVSLYALNILPGFFNQNDLFASGMVTMVRIFISIVAVMFFIPLIIDYGLPEFIGVFVRPLCRKLWKVPGRVAVVIVSAFFGTFTVGHMQANKLYLDGKATHKEALIMAIGFSTPSIGLIIGVTSAAGLMDKFPIIVAGVFLGLLAITSIVVHIPPLSRYPDEYYPGVTPVLEDFDTEGNIFKVAYKEGIEAAMMNYDKQPLKYCIKYGISTIPTIAKISYVSLGSIVLFGLINMYIPLFNWFGKIYTPVLALMKLQPEITAPNLGLALVSALVAQANMATAQLAAKATKIFGIGSIVIIILEFGSFIVSLFSTEIKVKFKDYAIIYFQRVYLTIIIFGAISHLIALL